MALVLYRPEGGLECLKMDHLAARRQIMPLYESFPESWGGLLSQNPQLFYCNCLEPIDTISPRVAIVTALLLNNLSLSFSVSLPFLVEINRSLSGGPANAL